ncbi:Endonuclease/exonuclease/phosphatase, partial [Lenzites betulinus]
IASLNVNGFGRATTGTTSDKWLAINQLMKEQRLAVLAVQEAHLNEDRLRTLNDLFGDRLLFLTSPDPTSPLAAGGVAFVVNRRMITTTPPTMHVLTPGRAAILTIQWTAARQLLLLNVYPPNRACDNAVFWQQLDAGLAACHARPMVLMGDFNFVEAPEDRLPPRSDPVAVTDAFAALRTRLSLRDSWRGAHPKERAFTFCQAATGSQSRLDRIYVHSDLAMAAADWTMGPAGVVTDHFLVGLSLANYQTPAVGPGRWSLPPCLLNDPPFMATMRTLGLRVNADLAALPERTATRNAQTIFAQFKRDLRDAARARHKIKAAAQDKKV